MRRVRPPSAEAASYRSRPLAGLVRPASVGPVSSSSAAAAAHPPDAKKTAKPAAYLAAAAEYRQRRRRRRENPDGRRAVPPVAPKTAATPGTPSRVPGSAAPDASVLYETIPAAVTPALLKAAADAPECKSCAATNKKSLEWIAAQQRRAFAEMDAEFAAERAKANPFVPAGDGGDGGVVKATASGIESKKSRASTASGDVASESVPPSSSSDTGDADRNTELAEKPAVSDARRSVKRKGDSATNGAETTATATTATTTTTKELRLGDASRVANTLMRDLVAELGVAKGKAEWVRRLGAWSRVDRATPSAPTISVDGSPPPPPSVAVARLHAALLRAECALAFTSPTVRAYDGERDSKAEQHDDGANDAAAATYSDVCRARYLCGQLTPHLASTSTSSRRSVARRSAELALAVGKLDAAGLQRATSRHIDATQLAARLASAREFVRDAVAGAASERDARSPSFHERVARRLAMLVYLHHAVASVARSAAVAAVHDQWRKRLAALVKIERGADGGALEWHSAARPIIDSYAAAPVSTF